MPDCGPETELETPEERTKPPSSALRFARSAGIFAGCLGAGLLSFAVDRPALSHLTVYLGPGVALALLLRYGTRHWPAVVAGGIVSSLARGFGLEAGVLVGAILALQAVITTHVLRHLRFRQEIASLRDAVLLIVAAAVASPALSATIATASAGMFMTDPDLLAVFTGTWIGDAIGVLIALPLVALSTAPGAPYREPLRAHPIEATVLFVLLVAICGAVFGGRLGSGLESYPLTFLPFPILLWIALQLGPLALAGATALVSYSALLGTSLGLGPFAGRTPDTMAALDWLFLGVMQVTFLMLGAVVAERTSAGEALRTERDRAEAATRAKSEFLSVMNHELRTPLNSMLLAVDLLLESRLTRPQRELGQTLLRAGEALRTVVGNTLDLSQIEEGRLDIRPVPFSPIELSHDVVDVFADAARRKGVELACVLDGALPQSMHGDFARLRQVLINLVGNAIKFTDEGRVELRTEAVGGDAASTLVRWQVRDSGIGIPLEAQATIFDPYVQVLSETRPGGGTGLGLAICRRLVERMGGRIGLESEPGRGSTLWFVVPLRREAEDVRRLESIAQGRNVA